MKRKKWQVVDNYANYEPYTTENPQMYIWDGDEQAAGPICDMGEMGDFNYAEALANAKLIAAAPELADRLEKCIRIMHNMADQLSEVGLQYLGQAEQTLTAALGN